LSREPINEDQVDKAYRAVFDCMSRVEEHFTFCVSLQARYPIGSGIKSIALTAEDGKAIVGALRDLRPVAEEAARLLVPLEKDLPALYEEAVKSGSVIAASWAEATLAVAQAYLRLLDGWERFGDLDAKGQQVQFRRCYGHMTNIAQFRASLKIEEARVRERARASSPEVRYAYEFLHLKPQSRRLFRFLTENPGRRLDYEVLAEAVFGERAAKSGRIQTAVFRLRRELEGFGSKQVADAITSEDAAYRFK
jgi:hypothetical protein